MIAAILTLGIIGLLAAVILYFVSQKFKVVEDPKIDEIEEVLPGANCGGCGFAGCRAVAESIVKTGSSKGKVCTAGGSAVNAKVAEIMGEAVTESEPRKVVLRCNGSCENAPAKFHYDSASTCAYANMLTAGESGCAFGCLGYGDCTNACKFDAIRLDKATGLPVIDPDKCVCCGACTKACPRQLLEIRTIRDGQLIWVACKNQDKGAEAKKNCATACIGCKKCEKNCEAGAITVTNNVAYIDETKCTACGKCAAGCPTKAIHSLIPVSTETKPEA